MKKKILIIFGSGIGDFIMFTPVLDLLLKSNQELKFFGIFRNKIVDEIFRNLVPVEKTIVSPSWEFRNVYFMKEVYNLREEGIDIAIIGWPHLGRKSAFLAYLSGAKIRIGHEYKWNKLSFMQNTFLTHKVKDIDEHYVQKNVRLVDKLIENISNFSLLFPLKNLKENELHKKQYILFHVGCNKMQKFRRWPIDYFSELANLFIENNNSNIVSVFGPDEYEEYKFFLERIKKKSKVFIVVEKDIFSVGGIVKNALFVVSNDSGISHIAAALGVPVFAIFGPANERHTYPWGFREYVIKKDIKCRPCYHKPGQQLDCQERKCLLLLYPYEVYKFILDKIDKNL